MAAVHAEPPSRVRPTLGLAVAIGLAAIGQWRMADNASEGLTLFVLAVVALVAFGAPLSPPRDAPVGDSSVRPRWIELGAAALLLLIAWQQSADNRYTLPGVIAWVGAVVCWLFAVWPAASAPYLPRWRRSDVGMAAVVVGVSIVGAVVKFADLPNLPAEMTSDHAEKLFDVKDVLDGRYSIYFERNTGREPMQFYVTAFLAGPVGLGVTHLALKVGTALIGALTVPLTYLAARWGAGTPRLVAVLAAMLLAISHWHTAISRVGLRFPYAPFGVALALIFLLRAIRFNDRRDWLLCGLALAVGLHGYTPFRVAPLLAVIGVVAAWFAWGGWRSVERTVALARNAALGGITALVAFAPLGHYALQRPDQFWYRSGTRLNDGQSVDVAQTLPLNIWNAVQAFHYRGDTVWVNTVPLEPFLDGVTGALFLVGFALVTRWAITAGRPVDVVLVVAVPVLMLPSVLSLAFPIENPSVVRMGGMLPVVAILAAWPLALLARGVSPLVPTTLGPATAGAIVGGLLAVSAQTNWQTYSVRYRQQFDVAAWNSSEAGAEARRWAAVVGGMQHVYHKAFPFWMDTRAIGINAGAPGWDQAVLDIRDFVEGRISGAEPRVFIVKNEDVEALTVLRREWAGGEQYSSQSRVPGKSFWVIVRPGYRLPSP